MSLNVGLVVRTMSIGGAEQQIIRLCQELSGSEVHLSLYILVSGGSQDLFQQIPNNIPVKLNPFSKNDFRILAWLGTQIQQDEIDVVHSFLWRSDAISSLSKGLRHFSTPLICSERGDRSFDGYSFPRRLFDRFVTFRYCDKICANSKFGANILSRSGCSPTKIVTISNGIKFEDIDSILPAPNFRSGLGWPENSQVVGIVSRLIWYKGVETLIQAFALISKNTNLYCVIIGDGPQKEELEALVEQLKLGERIKFLGKQKNVVQFIKNFDIAVLTTKTTEHCSNSIIEYMACQKPVIATNVGGNPEIILENQTGLLIPPNDPEALANSLRSLAENPSSASIMGQKGRIIIEQNFQMKSVKEKYRNLWLETAALNRRNHHGN